jgi:hypothetical protein
VTTDRSLALLEWHEGSTQQVAGGSCLAADWAGTPSWHKHKVGRPPPWGTCTPRAGSALLSELLEALPPGGPWWVKVWWAFRTEPGPMAEMRLSSLAWPTKHNDPLPASTPLTVVAPVGPMQVKAPYWVDLQMFPLAAVMEVMQS